MRSSCGGTTSSSRCVDQAASAPPPKFTPNKFTTPSPPPSPTPNQELENLRHTQENLRKKQDDVVREDMGSVEQRFGKLRTRIAEQDTALREIHKQQEKMIRLMSLSDRLVEQEKWINGIASYQRQLAADLQAPFAAEAESLQMLLENQARVLYSMTMVNIFPADVRGGFPMGLEVPQMGGIEFTPIHTRGGAAAGGGGHEGDAAVPYSFGGGGGGGFDPFLMRMGGGRGQRHFRNQPRTLGGLLPWPAHEPDRDAKTLRKAMKGLGRNAVKIIEVISTRTNEQRQLVAQAFNTNYKRDLVADLKSETAGNFRRLLVSLMMPPAAFDAQCIYEAVKGLGTDDEALIEILATRSNAEIMDMKEAYRETYGKDAVGDIRDDTSGNYRKLLLALLDAQRDESTDVNFEQVRGGSPFPSVYFGFEGPEKNDY